jgi:hypothetical protein
MVLVPLEDGRRALLSEEQESEHEANLGESRDHGMKNT